MDEKTRARALNNAYALLRMRPRSVYEIRSRLKLKRYDSGVIEDVIETLRRAGQIDDAKFARFWIESRMHANPAGDVVLRAELKTKGVADNIVESALLDKARDYDEYAIALDIARERFARLAKLDRKKAPKRLCDFLLRRGFKYDTVQKILDAIL